MWLIGLIACFQKGKIKTGEPLTQGGMVSIEPLEAFTGTELTCVPKNSDVLRNAVSVEYKWMAGENIISSAQKYIVDRDEVKVGDTIDCTVAIKDEEGSAAYATAAIKIQNTPVVVYGMVIIPDTFVQIDTELLCYGAGADPDQEITVSYAWLQNGKQIGLGEKIQLSEYEIQPKDKISCVGSATDYSGVFSQDSIFVIVEEKK